MKRVTRWFSVFLFTLLLVLSGLIGWIYYTDSGLRWTWEYVKPLLPQELTIQGLDGRLSERVTIEYFQWKDTDWSIEANGLSFDCFWLDALFDKYACKQLLLNQFTFHDLMPAEAPLTSKNAGVLPELPDIDLFFDLAINDLVLDRYQHFSTSFEGKPVLDFESKQVRAEKVMLERNVARIEQFSATFLDARWVLNGYAEMYQNWNHQLTLESRHSAYDFQLVVQGELKKSAKLRMQSALPVRSTFAANLKWDKNLTITQGELKLDRQDIKLGDQRIDIQDWSSNLNFSWPKLQLQSEGTAGIHNFKNIKIKNQLSVPDVTEILENVSSSIELRGDLYSTDFLSETSNFANAKVMKQQSQSGTKESFEILLDLKSEQNQVSILSRNFAIGNHSVVIKMIGQRDGSWIKDIDGVAEFSIEDLSSILGISNSPLRAIVNVSQRTGNWTVHTQGSLDSLAMYDAQFKEINWDLKFNHQWMGNLTIGELTHGGMVWFNSQVSLQGQKERHRVSVSSETDNKQHFELELDAFLLPSAYFYQSVSTSKAKPFWAAKNIKINYLNSGQSLRLVAEEILLGSKHQQIKNACLSGLGSLCVTASLQDKQYTLSSALDTLESHRVFDILNAWEVPLNIKLIGLISGHVDIQGKIDKSNIEALIEEMSMSLSSPGLQWKDAYWQAEFKDWTLNGRTQSGNHQFISNWTSQTQKLNSESWRTELESLDGELKFNWVSLDEFEFSLNQPRISWKLPHTDHGMNEALDERTLHERLLTIESFAVSTTVTGGKINSSLRMNIINNDKINGDFGTTWPIDRASSIDGNIDILIQETDWLKRWQSRMDELSASWQHNVNVSGTFNNPVLTGQGTIQIDRLSIEEIGLDIVDSHLNLLSQGNTLEMNGVLNNKQGFLKTYGKAVWYPELSAEIRVSGSELIVVKNKQATVIVSPDIQAQFSKNFLDVKGAIVFDEASLTLNAIPKQAIRVSDDQILIDKKDDAASSLQYRIDLDLETGKKVRFDGFGLGSEVAGKVKAKLESGKPVKVTGQMKLVNGKFEAYKQELTIEEGQLLFLGSAENPGIQFKAIRKVDDIKVGVIADGSISKPRLTLFSEPTMAQENILALLLTGRNIDSLSQSEGNALANAAIGLGVEGANKLAQKIGETLGIKNIQITSKTKSDSSRVDIGAQINDQLSVGYGTTIDSNNQMQAGWIIEYKLSPNLSIEAVSGEEVSASISYKKQMESFSEKDKTKKND